MNQDEMMKCIKDNNLPKLPFMQTIAFDESIEIKGYSKSDLIQYALDAIEKERNECLEICIKESEGWDSAEVCAIQISRRGKK